MLDGSLAAYSLLLITSLVFGGGLKVNDLLDEHGYKWGEYGEYVFAGFVGVAGVVLAYVAPGKLRIMWLAIIISWVVRGRIDSLNHGFPLAVITVFLLSQNTSIGPEFLYFAATFTSSGILHDFYQYDSDSSSLVSRIVYHNQYLYWYAIPIGYWILFEFNPALLISIYGFVQGYAYFYSEAGVSLLLKLGFVKS